MKTQKYTNRLALETSPYLLQHAHNPADWFPWGEEAFAKAQKENKPVLLSIGYSSCHWCHVMERESFENEEIAELMNRYFVSIKVDREERPDLDSIYMNCVQMLTGQGGWPMTLFLTPDGVPFYGGTYFPPDDQRGLPGFKRVMMTIAEIYSKNPKQVQESANSILEKLKEMDHLTQTDVSISETLIETAFRKLSQGFDYRYGGFGTAPKFPNAMNLSFFLRYFHRFKNESALEMADSSLQKMAEGGIYDQIGGGFHRYTVDERWLVPHFEKMLYDNALLISLYTEAYLITKNSLYQRIAEESLDYAIREMMGEKGEFYSTQDADSEGKEGKFYIWTLQEINSILGGKEGDIFCRYYGVTEAGNFEGKNILTSPRTYDQVARQLEISPDIVKGVLGSARRKIMAARELRTKPGRDEKALASWNGLMLSAISKAARVFNRSDYLQRAEENGNFLLSYLYKNGRLLHSYKDGQAKVNGYLDDYACVIDAFMELYQSTFESKWLKKAIELNTTMIDLFWDEEKGALFYTSRDHEKLIARMKDFYDNAVPSGNSVAAMNLLKLAVITGRDEYRRKAEKIFQPAYEMVSRFPSAFGYLLSALDFYFDSVKEIVVIGGKDNQTVEQFRKIINNNYLPNGVVLFSPPGNRELGDVIPLLEGKTLIEGKAAVYVCENFTCKEPVTTIESLKNLLGRK
ncbi:MAG: thioredoxin domain-containing protein [Candidatus Tectomicrobia bacterium]|uniref:Thioredoxin domain-containing protein n=1 Tax=Tectimicrobiota bacterium TaxID=2528274 RepID=A0A933GM12_UNCTE|nr:thioredoxin domain-containing protein [Candidatus Tectomicrobia bacterium]